MAAVLLVLALGAGLALGRVYGGDFSRLLRTRPDMWQLLAVGLAFQALIRLLGVGGSWAMLLEIPSALALIGFAIANIRIGGMVMVAVGLTLNFVVTVINWGMPTSESAMISAGITTKAAASTLSLDGPRHLATSDDLLRFLGEVIALPGGLVISIGDVLLHIGYVLVVASLMRGRRLRRDLDGDYERRIAPLGRGPAPRRGPGTHPSRLDAGQRPSQRDRTASR